MLEDSASQGLAGLKVLVSAMTDFGSMRVGPGRVRVIGGFLEHGLGGGVEMRASGQDMAACRDVVLQTAS